jgi:hypothetical protein
MTDTVTYQGRSLAELSGKPVRPLAKGRVCVIPECTTTLSIYNKSKWCHAHAPVKPPRLRGKMPSERMEEEERFPSCASCSQRNRYIRERHNGRERPSILLEGVMHREGDKGRATLCEAP